ncbi:MAG: ABC transporter substrate-binding protein [Actinomycetota bacterium]
MPTPSGRYQGSSSGPFISTELVSLAPKQVVVYKLSRNAKWSDGRAFTTADMVAWAREWLATSGLENYGYSLISQMVQSPSRTKLTVTFSKPFADWPILFDNIEPAGFARDCAISSLATRPSLGPYTIVSASPSMVVLRRNPLWTGTPSAFSRVEIHSSSTSSLPEAGFGVNYMRNFSSTDLLKVDSSPRSASHQGVTTSVESLGFSPRRFLPSRLDIRQALSWSINRSLLIPSVVGAIPVVSLPADSSIFAQGASNYPGVKLAIVASPSATTTTISKSTQITEPSQDCAACALSLLQASGYHRSGAALVDARGVQLALRVSVGPSAADVATSRGVINDWKQLGIASFVVSTSSESSAQMAIVTGRADVAIYTREVPLDTFAAAIPFVAHFSATSSYLGFSNSTVSKNFARAQGVFNPTLNQPIWASLDQQVSDLLYTRPLFAQPYLLAWTMNVGGVFGSSSEESFLTEIPTWRIYQSNLGS